MALGIDRAFDNPVGKLPPLRDRGSMLHTGIKVLSDWGVVAMGPKILINGVEINSDCGLHNFDDEVNLVTFEKASRKLIVGAYEIPVDSSIEMAAQLALDANMTVALGNFVDTKRFMAYGQTSLPLGAQDMTDPYGGGHCTYLVGYQTVAGKTIYHARNSWGLYWGKYGKYEATGAFLRQAWEAVVMDVRLAP